MKRLQCKLRTPEAVNDWLAFVSRIESVVQSPSFKVNAKQRNGDGFYSALQCDVEAEHMADVLTEYIAFLEKKPTLSFEMAVQESGEDESQNSGQRNAEC
jgi:hypothetical protein